ncbi:hypothetical protein GEMRC1_009440 [Eukaryota sp. GEM-RC1]
MEAPPGQVSDDLPKRVSSVDAYNSPMSSSLSPWKSGPNYWASCLSVYHPGLFSSPSNLSSAKPSCVDRWEMPQGQGLFAITEVTFSNSNKSFVAIGGAIKLRSRPKRTCEGGFVHLFEIQDDGKLAFVHTTELPDSCHCLCGFKGMLLAGSGNRVRLLALGRQRLLKKCEFKILPRLVVGLSAVDDRVFVSTVCNSVFYLKYRPESNIFQLFAEDPLPRHITSSCALDQDSIAFGDKFGTFSAVRISAEVTSDVEDDPLAYKGLREDSMHLSTSPNLTESLFNFYIGSPVTSLFSLGNVPGSIMASEVIVCSCFDGSIHVIRPFLSRADAIMIKGVEEFFQNHSESIAPLGRNHFSFRSRFFPVKNVVDFDLCRLFLELPRETKEAFCAEKNLDLVEVERILQDFL